MRTLRPLVSLLAAAILASPPALACGEGIFSMGDGLRYDGYLTPRPATILVFEPDGDASPERIAVYRGLARSGHRLTVVSDTEHISDALRAQSFDVLITDQEHATLLAEALPAGSSSRQLLAVPGKPSRKAGTSDRAYVSSSASLGSWLGALNRLMKD